MGPADVPQGRVVVEYVALDPARVHLEETLSERVADVVRVHGQKVLQVAVIEEAVVLVAEEVFVEVFVLLHGFGVSLFDLRMGEADGRDLEQRFPLAHYVRVGTEGVFGRRLYQVLSVGWVLRKSAHRVFPRFAFRTIWNSIIPAVCHADICYII